MSLPSFTSPDTVVISWIGVILNLCPKDNVASSTGPTLLLS
jgi:hypothetical protein